MVSAEITLIPGQTIPMSGEITQTIQALIDALEEHDDVQNVYTNAQWEE